MSPYDFVLTLVSFIYALAIAHVLMGAARMIRSRRELVFSWPHSLWMMFSFFGLLVDWLGLWDFHTKKVIDLATFAGAVVLCVLLFLAAALITPEFNRSEDYDLTHFFKRESPAYLATNLILLVFTIVLNAAAGAEGVANWARANGPVVAMIVPVVAAILVRKGIVQIGAPILATAMLVVFACTFSPQIG